MKWAALPSRGVRVFAIGLILGYCMTGLEILVDMFVEDALITSWSYSIELWILYGVAGVALLVAIPARAGLRPWLLILGTLPILALGLLTFLSLAYPVHLLASFILLIGACMTVDEAHRPKLSP